VLLTRGGEIVLSASRMSGHTFHRRSYGNKPSEIIVWVAR